MKATGDRDPGFVRDIRRLERQVADLDHRIRVAEEVHEDDIDEVVGGALALSTDTPQPIGAASAGSDTEASKSDHVHAHGNQAGGALHDAATGATAGFMSAADKTFLDTVDGRLDGHDTDIGDLDTRVGDAETAISALETLLPRAVLATGSQNLTRDGSNNALDTITIDDAYFNVRRLSMLVGPGVYSNNAACPSPWMEAGTVDGQIVILHNAGTQTIQINTTAKPNIRLESNANKSLGAQDYIVFIWNNADTRWDQLVTLMPLT